MNRPRLAAAGAMSLWARKLSVGSLIVLSGVFLPRLASAQGLDAQLRAGRTHSVDGQLATLLDAESAARLAAARASLLPSFTATGTYRRNQYEAVATIPDGMGGFQTGTFTPYNQLEATLVVDVPLLDLTAIRTLQAARRNLAASEASRELAMLEVDRAVARAYFDFLATRELAASARRSAEVANANLAIIEAHLQAGISNELELERARAAAARASERVADADRLVAEARRRLVVLTGVAPDPGEGLDAPSLEGDGTLSDHLAELGELPSVRAAEANVSVAQAELSAARSGFAPRINASASERFTNGAGFGYSPAWAVGLTATLRLGADTVASSRVARVQAERRALEAERARIDATSTIEAAFDNVVSLVARVDATRNEELAAALQALRRRFDGVIEGVAHQMGERVSDLFNDAFVQFGVFAHHLQLDFLAELFGEIADRALDQLVVADGLDIVGFDLEKDIHEARDFFLRRRVDRRHRPGRERDEREGREGSGALPQREAAPGGGLGLGRFGHGRLSIREEAPRPINPGRPSSYGFMRASSAHPDTGQAPNGRLTRVSAEHRHDIDRAAGGVLGPSAA